MNRYLTVLTLTRDFNLHNWARNALEVFFDPYSRWSKNETPEDAFLRTILRDMYEYPPELVKETSRYCVIGPLNSELSGAKAWKRISDVLVEGLPLGYLRLEIKKSELILDESIADMYLDTAVETFQWSAPGWDDVDTKDFTLDHIEGERFKESTLLAVSKNLDIADVERYLDVQDRISRSKARIIFKKP